MIPDEVTAYLHEHIPLSRHLGARLLSHEGGTLQLGAPLEPNLNHRGTAFGGSLSALAILSGWTLLHLELRARSIPCRLVIQRSALDFEAPVDGDFTAVARLPEPRVWERFLATLARHDRARVTVAGAVACASGAGGTHQGTYVALRGAGP
ncbi:MAG: YiiD C-terminal domain-containing protein [Deltaproteobacteria bacterium]|nr:YiiD C-terminal domain-containing protein [Deltaproteobacteria bacterium]